MNAAEVGRDRRLPAVARLEAGVGLARAEARLHRLHRVGERDVARRDGRCAACALGCRTARAGFRRASCAGGCSVSCARAHRDEGLRGAARASRAAWPSARGRGSRSGSRRRAARRTPAPWRRARALARDRPERSPRARRRRRAPSARRCLARSTSARPGASIGSGRDERLGLRAVDFRPPAARRPRREPLQPGAGIERASSARRSSPRRAPPRAPSRRSAACGLAVAGRRLGDAQEHAR